MDLLQKLNMYKIIFQLLARLLYQAARIEAYVDEHKIEQILGVTWENVKHMLVRFNSQSSPSLPDKEDMGDTPVSPRRQSLPPQLDPNTSGNNTSQLTYILMYCTLQ